MSLLRTVTRNVLSNWAGYVVSAAVAYELTPFVIEKLGTSAWGVWGMLVAVTGYYSLLDLGVRSAVSQYVTRYWASGDMEGVSRTMSTALGILLGISAVVIPVTLAFAWFVPDLFHLEGVDDRTAQLTFVVIGVGVAIDLPLKIFQTATYARQRFDIANAVGITQRLGSAWLTYLVLDLGYDLVVLSFVHVGTNILGNLIRIVIAFRMLPGLRLGRRHWSRSSVRELFAYGSFNVLVNAADLVQIQGFAIIIPIILTDTALAHFNAGAIAIPYMLNIVNAIAWTLTPQATAADARGDTEGLRRLWLVGSRAVTTFAAVFAAGFVFLGGDFLRIWLGDEFVSGEEFVSSGVILGLLAFGTLLRCSVSTAKQVCFGLREVRFLSRVTMLEALVNLVLTVVLTWQLGILGAALAGVIAVTVTQVWMLPRFVAKRIHAPLLSYIAAVPWPPLLVFATVGTLSYLSQGWDVGSSMGTFLLKAVVIGVPALFVGAAYGTTPEEKQRLLRSLRKAA
ncbi:MAG: polysaccharide biosynthesis C-terminal domain-containing protein [Planctomycetota bacterium]|nr:polysaccharide biosynthesis C-terminal domain-containing protein [Planctomycetota bacterium]MDA0933563.1 polysaccharide biosynthesis C-terminal domain-containing protein [Planctomycetota bacterium]